MPIWAVEFYKEEFDFKPSRRGVVKAKTSGEAFMIVKEKLEGSQHANLIPQVVRDEGMFQDGYREIPSN